MTAFTTRMREALRLTRSGNLRDATAAIRDALSHRGSTADNPIDAEFSVVEQAAPAIPRLLVRTGPTAARERVIVPASPADTAHAFAPQTDPDEPRAVTPGRFVAGSFSNAAGTRAYRLWIPRDDQTQGSTRRPLIVMLHGCSQDAEDFANGTRMNTLADHHHSYVLYPIQANAANAQRCWRWFEQAHQLRDQGEPSIVADMTRQLMHEFPIDPRRVYVAGLSAGAAMAVVLGETYPDVFAAVGVHSGVPYATAHDVPSAFAAMSGRPVTRRRSAKLPPSPRSAVRTIVIHGDRDTTVVPANSDELVQQLRASHLAKDPRPLIREVSQDASSTVVRFRTAGGLVAIEQWTMHGGGHAWSGGDARGSYTDPRGQDASGRMLQFFLGH